MLYSPLPGATITLAAASGSIQAARHLFLSRDKLVFYFYAYFTITYLFLQLFVIE